MTIFHAILFGVVEGLTEFIPVSSTAHLIILSQILGLEVTANLKTFEVAIQSGAILAVLFMYWRLLLSRRELAFFSLIAFLPSAVIGYLLYPVITNYFFESISLIAAGLMLGGIVLILLDRYWKRDDEDGLEEIAKNKGTIWRVGVIGLLQALSVIPGVSRAAASIVGGALVGFSRKQAAEFSFLLAVPTILASSAYALIQDVSIGSSIQVSTFVIGIVVSFLVALFIIKLFIGYLSRGSLTFFGVYRIIVAVLLFIYLR